jgi:hypothetical protein
MYPDGQAIHALFYFFEQEVLPTISKKTNRNAIGAIRSSLYNSLYNKNHVTKETFFSDFLYSIPVYFDILSKLELHCTQNNIPYFANNPLI